MSLETVAILTDYAEDVDIVCSAWKHAAARCGAGKEFASLIEH